jgi:hypothetical protein
MQRAYTSVCEVDDWEVADPPEAGETPEPADDVVLCVALVVEPSWAT